MTIKAKQKNVHVFSIDYQSDQDETRYQGKFTIKKLSIRDIAAMGVRKAQLNGGMHYDPAHPGRGIDKDTDENNAMIAHLELSIKDAPSWWNLDVITDTGLIVTVFQEVMTFEQTFLSRQSDGALARISGEGGSSTTVPQTNHAGSVVPVVVEKVQASLEP